ncbi:MAG: D-aminopeptidase DppA [Gemmatimonadales bacterium]|nr:D-aminopeptidase [bacterium HR33]GIW51775.1 MAG: D-aminopeptidase DppA [Gemmatimonadales bacterium]
MSRIGWLAFLLCAAVAPLGAQEGRSARALKVYISADMEGVVGTVTPDQLGPGGFEYERYRRFMTAEVNAAIAAAKSAGATQIVVSDSHGNGENLLIEELPEDVVVVRSWPRPLMMMQGIDSTFHAAIFIGYHASAVNPRGVRAHTISSARLQDVRLNGRSMPEGGINAAIAGYFGVPVVMVSGDDVAVSELKALLGDVEAAVVKRALSFHSAETLTPEAARRLIGEKVAVALRQLERFKPLVLPAPVALELRFKHYRPAEVLAYLPIVERVDAHSIRYVGPDILAVSRFLEFVTTYAFNLEP